MILRKLPSLALSLLTLSTLTTASLSPSDIPSDTPVSQLLSLAQTQLASGNAADALTYYSVAVEKDPSNYLTLFKRGATYLSLGKNAQASKDFDQVLVLKPGFEGALMQRAKLKGRGGDWEGARRDYGAAGKGKGSEEVKELDEAEGAAKLAAEAEKGGNWEECVTHAGVAIIVAGTSLELRERRARCRFEKGEVVEGIADLNHVLAINAAAIEPHLKISAMTYYSLGETEKGLTAISKCLHNDPDNKECTKLRKAEKALDRSVKKVNSLFEKRQFASAVKLLVPSPDTDSDKGLLQDVKTDIATWREAGYIHARAPETLYASLLEKTCECYVEMNNAKKAQQFCDEVLLLNADSLPALLNKAQRQIEADDFEPALGTLNHAKEVHGNNQKIQKLVQEAQTLLKRSKQKDYYKVLGLDRSASETEIKRAMRKLTKLHHPDKAAAHGISPEEAQKKMAAINEAYEVLSDPELKARFDRGEDPNDPMSGGGQPFQGSPFGFGAGGQPIFFQQRGGGGGGFPGAGSFKFQAGGGGGGGFPGGFPFG